MVFETDIYARRTRPTINSYSVTSGSGLSNPRVYLNEYAVPPTRSNTSSYSYKKTESSSTSSSDPYSRPSRTEHTSTVERRSGGGPGGYSYESTISTGSGPGGYSYSSTRSGPSGTRIYNFRA